MGISHTPHAELFKNTTVKETAHLTSNQSNPTAQEQTHLRGSEVYRQTDKELTM